MVLRCVWVGMVHFAGVVPALFLRLFEIFCISLIRIQGYKLFVWLRSTFFIRNRPAAVKRAGLFV